VGPLHLQRLRQLSLLVQLGGHVAQDHDHAGDLVHAAVHRAEGDLRLERRAVPAYARIDEGLDALPGEQPGDRGVAQLAAVAGEQHVQLAAGEVGGAPAEDLLGRGARPQDRGGSIEREDAVVGGRGDARQQLTLVDLVHLSPGRRLAHETIGPRGE